MFSYSDNESGAKLSKFRASSSNRSSGSFQQYPEDRIVEVLEINPANNGDGFLIVKDVRNNKKYHVVISNEAQERRKARSQEKTISPNQSNMILVDGDCINDKFNDALHQGNHFILTQTKYVKKQEVVDGEPMYFISTEWIRQIKDYEPHKQFYGIITASAFNPYADQYASNFQNWKTVGIPVDNQPESNAILEAEMKKFQEVADAFEEANKKREEAKEAGTKVSVSFPPRRGFQVRTLKVTTSLDENNNEVITNEVVDTYEPLLTGIKIVNDKGEEIERMNNITQSFLADFVMKYCDWAYSTFTEQDPSTYNLDEGIVPKDVLVEVCVFDSYMCNNTGNDNRINISKEGKLTPLDRMVRKLTKPSEDADENAYYQGMNLACWGIIDLVSDKADLQTKTFIERNIVRRTYLSGRKMNVHYLVKASNGGKIKISDKLRTKEELMSMQGGYNSQPAETQQIVIEDDFNADII